MSMWFDSDKRTNYGNNAALNNTKSASPTTAGVKGFGKAIANFADGKIKIEEKAKADKKIEDEAFEKDLEEAIKDQDQEKARKSLVGAYRKKHPKFSGDLDDGELFEYIKSAGKSVNNPDNGKVIDVHTAPDGRRYASVRKNGKITKEYLGKAKDYSSKSDKKSKDFGYGYNPNGSAKTATQFGEEQAKNRKSKKNKREEDIASLDI